MELSFYINEKAQGKARPRFSNGHAFTPQKTREFEERIRITAKDAMTQNGFMPTVYPVRIKVTAFFSVPKSYRKSFKDLVKKNQVPHIKKPDADNILKCVKDALNGVVYVDDSQCFSDTCEKYYTCESDHFLVHVTDEIFLKV